MGKYYRRRGRWKKSMETDNADERSSEMETYRQILQAGKTKERQMKKGKRKKGKGKRGRRERRKRRKRERKKKTEKREWKKETG
jgi:hypothetical protein